MVIVNSRGGGKGELSWSMDMVSVLQGEKVLEIFLHNHVHIVDTTVLYT